MDSVSIDELIAVLNGIRKALERLADSKEKEMLRG